MTQVINADYLTSAWETAIAYVLEHGEETSPRGLKTKELRNVTIHFDRQDCLTFENPMRRANPVMATVELMYFLNGRDDDVLATRWLGGMEKYVNKDTRAFDGGYGPSMRHGLKYAMAMLQKDPETRRASLSMMQREHTAQMLTTSDFPCNVFLWWNLHGGKLNMTCATRSQDLFYGYIYDQLEFHLLHRMMADALGKPKGSFDHFVMSLHLYEKDWAKARDCLDQSIAYKTDYRFPFTDVPGFWEYARSFNQIIDLPVIVKSDDLKLSVAKYHFRRQYKLPDNGPFSAWVGSWMRLGKEAR